MRRACEKAWWIVRKDFRKRVRDIVREHVLLNAIPYVEQETSSGLEDPLCLTVARLAVGKEHDAKLATNEIEGISSNGSASASALRQVMRLRRPVALQHSQASAG